MTLIRKQRTDSPVQDKAREELATDMVRELESVYNLNPKFAWWSGRFSPNTTSAPEPSLFGGDVKRVERVTTGHYRVYLGKRFKRLISWILEPTVSTTGSILKVFLYEDQSNAADPYIGMMTKATAAWNNTDYSNSVSISVLLRYEVALCLCKHR